MIYLLTENNLAYEDPSGCRPTTPAKENADEEHPWIDDSQPVAGIDEKQRHRERRRAARPRPHRPRHRGRRPLAQPRAARREPPPSTRRRCFQHRRHSL